MTLTQRTGAVPVPLDGYLNWKGVSWPERGITGRVDPHGSSLPGEALPNDTTIAIRDIPFRIPKTDSAADDLISCDGQRIALGRPMRVRAVHVLGFSVFGDYAERIGLDYGENAAGASVPFRLTDWFRYASGKPAHFGEEEGIVLPYYLEEEGAAHRPVALWVQRMAADPDLPLRELTLPENPFMYIMAITLTAS